MISAAEPQKDSEPRKTRNNTERRSECVSISVSFPGATPARRVGSFRGYYLS